VVKNSVMEKIMLINTFLRRTPKLIFIILLVIVNNDIFAFGLKEKENIELIKEKSYFNDFDVINEKVFIECVLTIKNNTNRFYNFRINALFEDDVKKLLENKFLEGYSEDLNSSIFSIAPNEIFEYKKVVFVGKFAGRRQKHDRALPEINIIIIEQR
jgi:hypothetical protein